jgi:hypothetical protein
MSEGQVTAEAQNQEKDYLAMTDDEIASMDLSLLSSEDEASDEKEEATKQEGDKEKSEESTGNEEEAKSSESDDEDADENEKASSSEEENGASDDKQEEKDPGESEEKDPKDVKTEDNQGQAIDYKAAYEKLTAPFKANGKEMRVDSVDDVIRLMQMGANYNFKMSALKPNLKVMKLLENNGLLDEQKLSFLIDLDKKNPEAITKLIKDSGIDPMDVKIDETSTYTPNTYTVDDREIDLDTAIEEIKSSDTYTKTIDIVSNKWDGPSKQTVANSPQLLKTINDHVARGVYDVIDRELTKERVLGRLNGLSDIEAYKQIGDAIQAKGGFDHLFQEQGHQITQPKGVVTSKQKSEDPAVKAKKRAVSSPKQTTTAKKPDFNPLSMSDEEFEKAVADKFL